MWNLLPVGSGVLANLDTTRVTDSGSTSTVLIVSGVLVLAAIVLIVITVWFWRNTVPDPDALESLVFFEERVVDGAHDPDGPARQRSMRSSDPDSSHGRAHLPRLHRKDRADDADRTELSERSDEQRHRRQRRH